MSNLVPKNINLPTLPSSGEASFIKYLQEIRHIPLLTEEEEYVLAKRLYESGDVNAAHKLVSSHLKLVAKIAFRYKGYGLPMTDIVAEGNIGLMHAVKKFNPNHGNRLSTYATWWIKASIQEYILRSWSLVKIGTTAAQKKLFFSLKKIKHRLYNSEGRDLNQDDITRIANELSVSEREVVDMDQRTSRYDLSLHNTAYDDSSVELIDLIAESKPSPEAIAIHKSEEVLKREIYQLAIAKLEPREREILVARRLREEPATLDDLSKIYNVSRERIRQIENRAFEKLRHEATNILNQKLLPL
jgi:RNA polymerase sigma-32 factor